MGTWIYETQALDYVPRHISASFSLKLLNKEGTMNLSGRLGLSQVYRKVPGAVTNSGGFPCHSQCGDV